MVSDQEPRYRLVDANDNIVGSLYGKPDGSIAIQETDSGSDREVTLAPDGTFSAPSVETDSVTTGEAVADNLVLSSDQVANISVHSGDQVTVSGNSTQTIFDLASPTNVLGGSIFGGLITNLTYTFSDESTYTFSDNIRGETRGTTQDSEYTIETVFSAHEVTKIEFDNRIGDDQVYGWRVLTI